MIIFHYVKIKEFENCNLNLSSQTYNAITSKFIVDKKSDLSDVIYFLNK